MNEIGCLAETLSTTYGLCIEAREQLQRASEALEGAVEPAAVATAKTEVEKARVALSTKEREVEFAERRARRKYPRVFDFLE